MEVGEQGEYNTYCYTITTRMTCIKMGSDESQFNVSLIVSDKVTRQCPQTTNFEEKGEPKQIRTEVLLLTGVCQVHPFTPQKAKHGAHVSGFPRVVKSS